MDALALAGAAASGAAILFMLISLLGQPSATSLADARIRRFSAGTVGHEAALPLRAPRFTTPVMRLLFEGDGRGERLAQKLELAGMGMRPGEFLLVRAIGAVAGAGIALLVIGTAVPGILAAIAFALTGWVAPRFYVARRTAKRLGRIDQQLVDLLTLIVSSVRAGFSLMQALDTAAQRVGAPLQLEVERLLADVRLGQSIDEALRGWADRIPSTDIRLLVTATIVQRGAGGNLAEVLENLALTMRERVELRQQVNALTAYPRMTAKVIAVYPVAMALMLTLMNRSIYGQLWIDPKGWALLGVALVFNSIAFFVMRRVVRVEF